MPIQVKLEDEVVSSDERQRLKALLCPEGGDLSTALGLVAQTALREYVEMFLGVGPASRADEARQFRLFYLIKGYFQNRIPSEAEVARMFQLSPRQSQSLIQAVCTRFRYRLEDELRTTLWKALEKPEKDDQAAGGFRLVIQSDYVVSALNRLIAERQPRYEPLHKVRNTARTFFVSEDSFQTLQEALNPGN